jgi:curved DNA-binding protein CbpA
LDNKGYYAILGIHEHATSQEVKKAYRRLARKYHPDRNNSCFAEDMIKKINAAFEVLSDQSKRVQYDDADFFSIQVEYDSSTEEKVQRNSTSYQHDTGYHHYSDHNNSDNNYFKSRGSNKDTEQDTGLYTMPLRTLLDIPKGRFHIIVEPSLCMAFGSCETLAPKVFVLEKNKRINPKAKVVSETGADFDAILAAAQTCPTKAIRIIDRYTGEQIYP